MEQTTPNPLTDADARTWATLSHLGVLAGFVIPFGHLIAPLLIWLILKERSAFVDAHGKEALNFQIIVTFGYLIAGMLVFFIIGIVLFIAIAVVNIVFSILAATQANQGNIYKYPINLKLIS